MSEPLDTGVAQWLGLVLDLVEENERNYDTRYGLVLQAMQLANTAGYQTGIRIDPQVPEWPVVFIELPTGQVSWHLPQHPIEWDGHSTEEKYARCRAFREQQVSEGA